MIELAKAGASLKPLTWRRDLHGGGVSVKCGNGHIGAIAAPDHTIDGYGIVTPSLVCPWYQGCDWHETVRLIGWAA